MERRSLISAEKSKDAIAFKTSVNQAESPAELPYNATDAFTFRPSVSGGCGREPEPSPQNHQEPQPKRSEDES